MNAAVKLVCVTVNLVDDVKLVSGAVLIALKPTSDRKALQQMQNSSVTAVKLVQDVQEHGFCCRQLACNIIELAVCSGKIFKLLLQE